MASKAFEDTPTEVLRATLRHNAFNLDRAMKSHSLYSDGPVPGRKIADNIAAILDCLADRGVSNRKADLLHARHVLNLYERYSADRDYDFSNPHESLARDELAVVEKVIRSRRSVRFWTDDTVPVRLIKRVCEAALWAPSACNTQPVRFIIVRDKEMLRKVNEIAKHPQVERAPVLIFVALDEEVLLPGENTDNKQYLDAGAAVENMLLEAYALGLGACWMGQKTFRTPAMHTLLTVPDNIKINSGVVLGYPLEAPLEPGRISLSDAIIASC